ncbi:MAG: DUF6785 family protein [Planctomycetota bacterium]
MPWVGVILGLALAAWVSAFTLFNDAYLRQPLMTGNLMPTSVYGPAVLLLLLAGGAMCRSLWRRGVVSRADVVAVVVIGTAACAWPGTNLLRTFVGSTGNVANLAKTADAWRDAGALDYLPDGVLLADGRETAGVTDTLTAGAGDGDTLDPAAVPWSAWWPVLRLWGGLALLLGAASLCLGVIVHPQWARYEKLPYPLVRFVEELTKPNGDDAHARPAVLGSRLFWLGLLGVLTIHLFNGLSEWGFELITFQIKFDQFAAMQFLLPSAAQVQGASEQFRPAIYFSVVAFVFFIRGDVSFSVGVSNFAWLALGAAFLARGQSLGNNPLETDPGPLLRAGAYLGFAAMIVYLGRRHYARVAAAAVGLRRPDTSAASAWAARGLVLSVAGAVWLLAAGVRLDWRLSLLAVLVLLVLLLILARLSAETGMFYLEPNWMPLVVLAALFGFEGLGPSAFLGLALFSTVLAGAPREPLLGYVVNALRLADTADERRRTGRVALGFGVVAAAGLLLATGATLVVSHSLGLSRFDTWANRGHPSLPFDALSDRLSDLIALDQLEPTLAAVADGHFAAATPDAGALLWLGLGVVLVVGCASARLRLPWWPIHPVLFLVLGTSPAIRVGWSFLIGWAIRQAVLRLGGVRAFHATLPLAVGAIAGELLAAVGWQAAGLATHFFTDRSPGGYFILPN